MSPEVPTARVFDLEYEVLAIGSPIADLLSDRVGPVVKQLFDLRTAPFTGLGYMVTDYEGLVAVGNSFTELFVTANSGNASNPTDVFATSTETPIGRVEMLNEHVEINFRPRSIMEQRRRPPERP
jgi:hypothetical protein